MYLIRVDMDRNAPEVRMALADCEKMHVLVTGLFGTQRMESSVLYRFRLEQNTFRLYLYASRAVLPEVCQKYPTAQRDISAWVSGMKEGQVRPFDLTAAPSKKIPDAAGGNSRRRILRQPLERQQWLERKGEQYGFRILECQELEQVHLAGTHRPESGGRMHLDAWHYQGLLQITDEEKFRYALVNGIGSGKAYGFGMLMIK